MTLNLTNPITEDLRVEHLAGANEPCQEKRTGYEVILDGDKFALKPIAKDEQAKIGEEVTVSSMGKMRRGQVVRVLSGYEHSYIDQKIVDETEDLFKVQEVSHSTKEGITERDFEVPKDVEIH
ncbi:MAG: hypothetical protein M0T74_02270 [Desulfitobacterium hafniense]|nr:hypothetical protein [Desulfitobacterium hafniense]